MIQILAGENIELEIDPNENGLPILIIHAKYGAKTNRSLFLARSQVEHLIKELGRKLDELVKMEGL
jgi:hypothetical protein